MTVYVLFLIVGLGLGSVYAALALGLVVTYKGTGVINFAQGAMAMWGAFVYDELRKSGDLVFVVGRVHVSDSVPVAVALGIASSAAIGGLAHLLVFRPLRRAPALAKIVASLGLLATLQALVTIRFGSTPRAVKPVLPTDNVELGSLVFSVDRIYLSGLVIALALGAWAVLRFTRHGTAIRAAAEDERSAEVLGYAPQRLAAASWIVGAAIGGAVAICAAPSTTLDASSYALYVVPALAAALLGQLSSIGLAVGAGLAFGAVQSELTYLGTKSWWPSWAAAGVSDVLPLLVVIVALFVVGKNLPTRSSAIAPDLPAAFVPTLRPALMVAGRRRGDRGIGADGRHVPLRHHHVDDHGDRQLVARPADRIRRPGLAGPGGVRRDGRIHHVPAGDGGRHPVPVLARARRAGRERRRTGRSRCPRCACAARSSRS